MHEALFGRQDEWSGSATAVDTFKTFASELGVDQARFDACLDEGQFADNIQADLDEGAAAGVTGTPAFRINDVALSGAQGFDAFQQQIEYFLAGGQPPAMEVAADSYRSRGEADAPVVITEFSDYQCPACAQVEQEMVPELIARYVDTGQARLVYREFPLTQIHPYASKASEAAICAGRQDAYWEMHDKLFATQDAWTGAAEVPVDVFKGYAQELGLDTAAFDTCLDSGEAAVEVQGDLMTGESVGVNATPTFFVNDLPVRGGLPIETFGQVIEYVAAGGEIPEILPTGDDWRLAGNKQTAGAIAVAFVDYANADSATHARDVLPQLRSEYIDTGKLIYVLHPYTEGPDSPGGQAAIAAECAGQQAKFWQMHDLLFEKQADWLEAQDLPSIWSDYAASLDLDETKFEECLASDWAALRVRAGTIVGTMYGVPTANVFLFNSGQALEGTPTYEEFKTVIDAIVGQ